MGKRVIVNSTGSIHAGKILVVKIPASDSASIAMSDPLGSGEDDQDDDDAQHGSAS
jgi:hypothetical protein